MQQKLLKSENLWQPSTLGHYHNTCTRQINGLKSTKNHLLQLFLCLFKERVKKGKRWNRFKLIVLKKEWAISLVYLATQKSVLDGCHACWRRKRNKNMLKFVKNFWSAIAKREINFFEYCYWRWVMDSSFWPWRKMTEHAIQAHFISLPEKIQNSAVCRQDSFDCILGPIKSLHDRIFGSWEYCQFSSVHWNNKKPTAEGVSS